MPTSGRKKLRRSNLGHSRASEMFYLDQDGNRQDADLHNPILRDGDDAAALAVSEAVKKRILGNKESG